MIDVRVRTYVARPVDVEAVMWPGSASAAEPVLRWIGARGGEALYCGPECMTRGEHLQISRAGGVTPVYPGDWVVRGVDGTFDAVRPATFGALYDEVTDYPSDLPNLIRQAAGL
jgi:hypothetical protein